VGGTRRAQEKKKNKKKEKRKSCNRPLIQSPPMSGVGKKKAVGEGGAPLCKSRGRSGGVGRRSKERWKGQNEKKGPILKIPQLNPKIHKNLFDRGVKTDGAEEQNKGWSSLKKKKQKKQGKRKRRGDKPRRGKRSGVPGGGGDRGGRRKKKSKKTLKAT